MHVISDEGEIVRPNENSKSSDLMYQKKDTKTYTSLYDRVLNALKKLDTLYNLTVTRMNQPVKYKATGDTGSF